MKMPSPVDTLETRDIFVCIKSIEYSVIDLYVTSLFIYFSIAYPLSLGILWAYRL